jgi:hypothetical protein
MSLSIEDFLRKITLPKRYFSDSFIISEKYQEEKENYFNNLDRCCGNEFPEEQQQKVVDKLSYIHTAIRQNFESILNIFDCHENANPKSAQIIFDSLMDGIKKDLFFGTIDDRVQIDVENQLFYTGFRITPGHRYFRVRPVDSSSETISKNADELFHIPISKRQNSSNERFSLAGFPSLYLSTMLPLAWQECGYPVKYYYSEYQYEHSYDSSFERRIIDDDFKFISLYSPDEINWWGTSVKYNKFDLWLEVIARYLKIYPLILACSFVNSSGKSPYKQEYIVPQMLMQWVQRNSSEVQGITYFTCLDTSTFTEGWCAYNIALPALPPYDGKMYSIKLKEKFCWTNPIYYSIPIADKQNNELDRKIVDGLISDIKSATRTLCFPNGLRDCLREMLQVSGCFLSLLSCGSNTNMHLVLHMLSSIDSNFNSIKRTNEKTRIAEAIKDKNDPFIRENSNLDEVFKVFNELYNSFAGNINGRSGIGTLVEKYKRTMWNDLHPHSQIIIMFIDYDEITELKDWMKENHILYFCEKLKSDDHTVKLLKEISESQKMSLDEFWETPVGNDEWVKDHINSIKHPIIVKQNDVSILSPKETVFYEFVRFGFNKDELGRLLKI